VRIPLSFTLTTSDTNELVETAEILSAMWHEAGVQTDIEVFDGADFVQSVVRPRQYEALLFGLHVGHAQDHYLFWHSSGRNDPGLNIAQLVDIEADALLEKLRTVQDIEARTELLAQLEARIDETVAAIFLYATDYLYLATEHIQGVTLHKTSDPSERFDTVHLWYTKTDSVSPFFVQN
jgi:peptide/nickel transport system substrate-binding protein